MIFLPIRVLANSWTALARESMIVGVDPHQSLASGLYSNPMAIAEHSLTSALTKAGIPSANHEFIRHLAGEIGVSGYRFVEASERYVAAPRRDGLGELRFYSGYTLGFLSEEEARRVAPGADTIRQSSKSRKWFVSHPQHGNLELRGARARRTHRPAGSCPNGCGYELSLTGHCPACDS